MNDPDTITMWRRLDDRITTSGQPNEAELRALAKTGVRTVINLALETHEKALPNEAGIVAALGMRYVHIPVAFDNPTEQDFQRFREAFEATGTDAVHVHCIMNYRVSAFFYRYRRDVLHMNEDAARTAMLDVWSPNAVWSRFIGLRHQRQPIGSRLRQLLGSARRLLGT